MYMKKLLLSALVILASPAHTVFAADFDPGFCRFADDMLTAARSEYDACVKNLDAYNAFIMNLASQYHDDNDNITVTSIRILGLRADVRACTGQFDAIKAAYDVGIAAGCPTYRDLDGTVHLGIGTDYTPPPRPRSPLDDL